ncbi:hypothetical protein BsWGS_07676 [Bradybaena similaris]
MSLFSGGKSKDTDPLSKKSKFYVEFLGWMECRGVRGHKYTDPVMRELRRRQKNMDAPPKLTIEVNRKELKITQSVPDKGRKGFKKVKFPTIPTRDVTYVQQAIRPGDGRLDDTVACIYLGYMPRTQRYVHVHVYRFDEAKTAALFATQMAAIVEDNYDRIQKVEIDLAKRGEIEDARMMPSDNQSDARTTDSAVGSASSSGSNEESSAFSNEDIDPDLQSLRDVQPFDSVTDELKYRLQVADRPLLLPPKDYDTIRRGHGNLKEVNRRRCLNLNIVGENAVLGEQNGSSESGVDLHSPVNEPGYEVDDKVPVGKRLWPPQESSDHLNRDSQQNPKADFSQMHQKLLKLNIMKNIPQELNASNVADLGSSKSRGSLGNKSPEISGSFAEKVYPPKKITSAVIYQHPQKATFTRQCSEDSPLPYYMKESSRGAATSVYQSDSSNDIYSLPLRAPQKLQQQMSLNENVQPGYRNDFSENLQRQGWNQEYRRSYISRAKSEDYTVFEEPFGITQRPSNLQFQERNRKSSLQAVGPQYAEHRGLSSSSSTPPAEKLYFGKRN